MMAYRDLALRTFSSLFTQSGFNAWKFDGCSCLPDQFLKLFTGCDWRDITYKCCLPHDLCYAYGERKRVDTRFFDDLVNKAGMKKWMARAFLTGVRIGGPEAFGLSFSWGFARKKLPYSSRVDS